MIRENLAERLFCDLKNAGIKIDNPKYVEDGSKIGNEPNMEQLVLSCKNEKYNFNKGPAVEYGEMTFTQAYTAMLDYVKSLKSVKFYNLVIPRRGVVAVDLVEFEKVTSRYIKDYLPMSDEIMERWDIIIGKT